MKPFKDNDEDYLNWIKKNSIGYVVNCNRNPTPNYLKLHRATCKFISGDPTNGNFWTRNYLKMCSLNLKELENWAHNEIGGKLSHCPFCKP